VCLDSNIALAKFRGKKLTKNKEILYFVLLFLCCAEVLGQTGRNFQGLRRD
jgi:hypothetical protein